MDRLLHHAGNLFVPRGFGFFKRSARFVSEHVFPPARECGVVDDIDDPAFSNGALEALEFLPCLEILLQERTKLRHVVTLHLPGKVTRNPWIRVWLVKGLEVGT